MALSQEVAGLYLSDGIMHDHYLPPSDDLSWFSPCRQKLLKQWGDAIGDPVASLGSLLNAEDGPLSLATSIAHESGHITQLLANTGFDQNPITFLRCMLILLDQFGEQLENTYEELGRKPPKAPKSVSIWTNHYAKHRASFFKQHHVVHVFQDNPEYASMYEHIHAGGLMEGMCLRSPLLPEPVFVISQNQIGKLDDLEKEGVLDPRQRQLIVLAIPSLSSFVQAMADYCKSFIEWLQTNPEALRGYQSWYHMTLTPEKEAALIDALQLSGFPGDNLRALPHANRSWFWGLKRFYNALRMLDLFRHGD